MSLAGLVGLILTACVSCEGVSRDAPLLVMVAASTADVVGRMTVAVPRVQITSGGSFALERQIEAGAPADLFVSAGRPPVEALLARGLANGNDVRSLAGNDLVVVVPAGRLSLVKRPEDLLSLQRIALGDPETVPAGFYARAALKSHHLWSRLQNRLIRAADVRAVLAYVESGAVQAGVVYGTDARISRRVRIALRFAPRDHPPIQILAVVLKAAPHRRQSLSLLRRLVSPSGRELLLEAGFLPPSLRQGEAGRRGS